MEVKGDAALSADDVATADQVEITEVLEEVADQVDEITEPAAVDRTVRMLARSAPKGNNSWFSIKDSANDTVEVDIYDEIGGWGIRAADFIRDVKAKVKSSTKKVKMRINSPGGVVFDGIAIGNALAGLGPEIEAHIDGIAASIASVIAAAADRVVMPENAMIMIHDPSAVVWGGADDMRQMADAMDKIKDCIVSSYKKRMTKSEDEISAMMSAETWLSAAEAKELGLADEVVAAKRIVNTFDLSKYKNAPEQTEPQRDLVAEAIEIAEICAEAGIPAADFIANGVEPDAVRARVAEVKEIKALAAKAKVDPAPLLAGTVDSARKAILEQMVARQSPEIINVVPVKDATPVPTIDYDDVWNRSRGKSRR